MAEDINIDNKKYNNSSCILIHSPVTFLNIGQKLFLSLIAISLFFFPRKTPSLLINLLYHWHNSTGEIFFLPELRQGQYGNPSLKHEACQNSCQSRELTFLAEFCLAFQAGVTIQFRYLENLQLPHFCSNNAAHQSSLWFVTLTYQGNLHILKCNLSYNVFSNHSVKQ